MNSWQRPVALALSVQVITTAADVAVPVLAPLVMAAAGVPSSHVGYYASVVAVGAMIFYLFGAELVHRAGALRSFQLAVALCALALTVAASGHWWAMLSAGLLLGIGFGAFAPASGVMLQALVPKKRLTLAFSVKQAGMPAGAILAGICLPLLAALWSWQAALLCFAGLCVAVLVLIEVFRDRSSDVQRAEGRSPSPRWFDLRRLSSLAGQPAIRRLMICGGLLAIVQGSVNAFLVTYLVSGLGHTLLTAGWLYSLFQLAGIPGRIASGWLADRVTGRLAMLAITSASCALLVASLAFLKPSTSPMVVAVCTTALGLMVGNWNAISIAEATNLAPSGRVPEANNVLSLGNFAGFILGPLLFGVAVSSDRGFQTALFLLALCALLSGLPLLQALSTGRKSGESA